MSTRSTNLGLFELPCAKSSKIRHSVRYRGCKLLNCLLGLNAPLPCLSRSSKQQVDSKYVKKLVEEFQLSNVVYETIFQPAEQSRFW